MKKLLGGLLVFGAVKMLSDAISDSGHEKHTDIRLPHIPETNEHDAEMEIFRAMPMPEHDFGDTESTRIRSGAYVGVEMNKQDSYTQIALAREQRKMKESDRDSWTFIALFGFLGAFLFGLIFLCYKMDSNEKEDTERHLRRNEISVPMSSSAFEKEDYKTVEKALRSAGFEDIELVGKGDLITGWITKENSVDKVYINGDCTFKEGDWFPADAEIVISYHSFK